MKKIISILLLSGLLLSCFSGCTLIGGSQTENPTETPTETPVQETHLRADILAQIEKSYGSAHLDIYIRDGEIYIYDDLCEKAEKVNNPIVSFAQDMKAIYERQDSEKLSEVLTKIKSCESCYMLQTQGELIYGRKTAVYCIDGLCYFVILYDDVAYRIYESAIQIDSSFYNSLSDGTQVKYPTDKTNFSAKTIAQLVALSWSYDLKVRVAENTIYLNDVLYEATGPVNNPIVEFYNDMEALNKDILGSDRISDVLQKILESESCYILEAEDYNKYGEQIAVYDIDGFYYFVAIYNGMAYRIHGAEFFDN